MRVLGLAARSLQALLPSTHDRQEELLLLGVQLGRLDPTAIVERIHARQQHHVAGLLAAERRLGSLLLVETLEQRPRGVVLHSRHAQPVMGPALDARGLAAHEEGLDLGRAAVGVAHVQGEVVPLEAQAPGLTPGRVAVEGEEVALGTVPLAGSALLGLDRDEDALGGHHAAEGRDAVVREDGAEQVPERTALQRVEVGVANAGLAEGQGLPVRALRIGPGEARGSALLRAELGLQGEGRLRHVVAGLEERSGRADGGGDEDREAQGESEHAGRGKASGVITAWVEPHAPAAAPHPPGCPGRASCGGRGRSHGLRE